MSAGRSTRETRGTARSMSDSGRSTMALLVFFAAAARTRIVATNLRFVATNSLDVGIIAADTCGLRTARPGARNAG